MEVSPDTVVLLGAGASADSGIPMTVGMTRAIMDGLESKARGWNANNWQVLNFVCGTLAAHDAALGAARFDAGLDVERVFAAVQLLAQRHELEITPFVSAWITAVDGWDATRPFRTMDNEIGREIARKIDGSLRDQRRPAGAGDRVAKAVVKLIEARNATTPSGEAYVQLGTAMISELRGLLAKTSKDVGYLRPLVALSRGSGGLTIATLNYDRSIELACQAERIECSTGIHGWSERGRFDWSSDGISLLKLHGSIDWVWTRVQEPDAFPHMSVTQAEGDTNAQPALVFGQGMKLRADGPFLGLLAAFEDSLASAFHLLVIGYSFRDEHVNVVIGRWLSERNDRRVTVIDPSWPIDEPRVRPLDFRDVLNALLSPSQRIAIYRARARDVAPNIRLQGNVAR